MITRAQTGHLKPKKVLDLHHNLASDFAPNTYKSALQLPQWKATMQEEFSTLESQNTWPLVLPPNGHKILGCKWVFKTKLKLDGTIARHKVRLVAQCYRQQEGIDYFETFNPVAKLTIVRIFITLTTSYGWTIKQLDASNAFLQGHLSENIYMRQSPRFEDSQYPSHICKLHQVICSLKQSQRQWFATLTSHMQLLGFQQSTVDSTLHVY